MDDDLWRLLQEYANRRNADSAAAVVRSLIGQEVTPRENGCVACDGPARYRVSAGVGELRLRVAPDDTGWMDYPEVIQCFACADHYEGTLEDYYGKYGWASGEPL